MIYAFMPYETYDISMRSFAYAIPQLTLFICILYFSIYYLL